MDTTDNIKLRLNMLIDGYFKSSLCYYNFISVDIIEIICAYYGYTQNSFIVAINGTRMKNKTSKYRCNNMIKLIDVVTKISYPTKVYFTQPMHDCFCDQPYYGSQFYCIGRKCLLPICMKTALKSKYNNLISNELLSSNQWHLIFRFGIHKQSHITALYPSLYSWMYRAYNFVIPSPTVEKLPIFLSVYNQTQKHLYSLRSNCIYEMKLDNSIKTLNDCKWNKWNKSDSNFYIRNRASVCMVDNDKYIACMNANGLKSYLFALNSTKLSIRLANACEERYNHVSMYHSMYHKIITVGVHSAEMYDINKDKSMIISRYYGIMASNIWFSPLDPNIVYCGARLTTATSPGCNGYPIGIFSIDLRDGSYKQKICCRGNYRKSNIVYVNF